MKSGHTHSTSVKPVNKELLPPQAWLKCSPSPVADIRKSARLFEPLMDHYTRSSHCVHTAKLGNPLITVVHQSGIFTMEILYCACVNAADYDEQLMNARLFP
jgi:hypothetical protein